MHPRFPILAGVCALIALAAPPAARAQSAHDLAAGKVLFDEGKKLMADRNYAAACRKFEASLEILDSVSVLGQLAMCYEQVDRKADAWAAWQRVKARSGTRADQRDTAIEHIAQLAPQLAYVTITVVTDAPGLAVERDGRRVRPDELGVAVPANRGRHVITATAPGRARFEQTVTVENGDRRTVSIDRLAIVADAADAAAAPVSVDPRVTRRAPARPLRRWVGLGTAGVGVIALGVAGGLTWSAAGARDDARRLGCGGEPFGCPPGPGLDRAHTAYQRAELATAFTLGGLALVAAGGALHFLLGGDGEERPDGGGLRVGVSTSSTHLLVSVGASL